MGDVIIKGPAHKRFKADVSKVADVEQLIKDVVREMGPPDILVNNAGIQNPSTLLEYPEETFDEIISINLKVN